MKRLLLLALLMTSITAMAFTVDGISYFVLVDMEDVKVVRVACQTEPDQITGDVVIPGQVNYEGSIYTVEEIDGGAFFNCSKMTSISIPATVKRIGPHAFDHCSGLKAVHLEDLAAWCAVRLDSWTDSNPVSMAHHVFVNDEEVKELVIPEGVTAIGAYAFRGAAITSIVLPASVSKIGEGAFCECSSLTTLPSLGSLRTIDSRVFAYCTGLKEVSVPEGIEKLGNGAFNGCGNMTAIHLPQSLRTIGNFVFVGCNQLLTIDIPNQVMQLGAYSFNECQSLTEVKLSDNISEIEEWTFARCPQLKTVHLPKNLQRMGDYAFFYCPQIEELSLSSTLMYISPSALNGCTGLRGITVESGNPNYLSEDGALFNREKTKLMLFPAQSDMMHYDIPATVTNIVAGAFIGSKLKSITLPSALPAIGGGAFSGMSQLEDIVIPSSVTSIGSGAFNECTSLKEIVVPDNVQSIGTSAFEDCSSLVKVHLPEGLKRIEGGTFSKCSNLIEVNIPNGVSYIGMLAFNGCYILSNMQLSKELISIDQGAFEGCQKILELTIQDKVEKLASHAFFGCSGLEKLTIGKSVSELGEGAFYGCDNIREIWSYIQEPFDVVDVTWFDHDIPYHAQCFPKAVADESILYVPQGTIDKYRSKKGWCDFSNIVEMNPSSINNMSSHYELHSTCYDLQGRRLNGKPVKGMYIQGGKKHVVK